MKEYPISIPTNSWNAVRYGVFTLLLVPLAEKLLTRIHARRTGQRLMQGSTARVRQSRLAHYGLHQEVDEESRLSKVSAIVICILHVGGSLLLEYGNNSSETCVMQNAIVSPTIQRDGRLLPDGMYFIDASYILGRPYGSSACIDGGPRHLSDFGLKVKKTLPTGVSVRKDVVVPHGKDKIKAEYFVKNSGYMFQMHDDGKARWYGENNKDFWKTRPDSITAFANKTVTCLEQSKSTFECIRNNANVDYPELLSDALAISSVPGTQNVNSGWRQRGTRIRILLNHAIVTNEKNHPLKTSTNEQTAWVRSGMRRKGTPRKTELYLKLGVHGLRDDCEHSLAIPVSSLQVLKSLNTSKRAFPGTKHRWNGDHKLLALMHENRTMLGTLTQTKHESCSAIRDTHLCVRRIGSAESEVALYRFEKDLNSSAWYTKLYSFSVHGSLTQADALDVAVQAHVEARRKSRFAEKIIYVDSLKRVVRQIESEKVVQGLVRRMGPGSNGKSLWKKEEIATINILGIVSAAILVLLVVTAALLSCVYREKPHIDLESSYRRAVLEIHGRQSLIEVPPEVPTIVAMEIRGENLWIIQHRYRDQP